MSRFRNDDDLAYGDIPQRWDRERFERFGSRAPPRRVEDDYYYAEQDRPGHRDVAVAERHETRAPRGRFDERDRFFEDERRLPSRPRRRTDRELFGDVDPYEIADMALVPRRKSVSREELDIDIRAPRPGLIRRQSSLDTFDRKPARYERDEYRMPPYQPVPLPIRRRRDKHENERRHYERHYEPQEDYREVEIQRERSMHRRRAPKTRKSASSSSSSSSSSSEVVEEKKSKKAPSTRAPSTKAPSTKAKSTKAPSTIVEESLTETSLASLPPAPAPSESIHESIRQERKFKKGKTRMPKRLVRREAIMDLGYPFEEEEDFFVLTVALEKEQIDEVMQISEQYKDGEKKRIYRYEQTVEESPGGPPPVNEHETVERTEWINPPTVIGRRGSPSAKSSISQVHSRSRRPSSPRTYVPEQTEEIKAPPAPQAPPPPEYYEERKTIVEERIPGHHHNAGTLVLAEREQRSNRDINQEIRALEAERRALRLERDAGRLREEDYQLVEYRDRGRPRDELVIYERERTPPRNVIRVEKDRKERRNAKLIAAAMATLT